MVRQVPVEKIVYKDRIVEVRFIFAVIFCGCMIVIAMIVHHRTLNMVLYDRCL